MNITYNGLLLAGIYGILGLGLALIWNAVGLLNMAHGALFTLGGYASWIFLKWTGFGAVWGLPVSFAVAGFVGAGIYYLVLRRLLENPNAETTTIVAGLGILMMIEAAILLIFGPNYKSLPPLASGTFPLPGDVVGRATDVFVVGTVVATLVLLGALLNRTRLGLSIRALSQDLLGARLMGVSTTGSFVAVMFVGSGLAGLAGNLLANTAYLSPGGGFDALIKGLIITVVGGLGSLRGTLLAALSVGFIETAASYYLGERWGLPVLFCAIFILFIIRPSGLAGTITVVARGSK